MTNTRALVLMIIAALIGIGAGFKMGRQTCTLTASTPTVIGTTVFYGSDPPRITIYFSDGTQTTTEAKTK